MPNANKSPLVKSAIKYKESHGASFVHRPANMMPHINNIQPAGKQNVIQPNQNHIFNEANNPPLKQELNMNGHFEKQNVMNMIQNHKFNVENIPPLNQDLIGNNHLKKQNMIQLNQNRKFNAENNPSVKNGLNMNNLRKKQNHKVNNLPVKEGLNLNSHVEKHLPFGRVKGIKGQLQQNAPREIFHFQQQDYQSQKRQGRRLLVEKSMAGELGIV